MRPLFEHVPSGPGPHAARRRSQAQGEKPTYCRQMLRNYFRYIGYLVYYYD